MSDFSTWMNTNGVVITRILLILVLALLVWFLIRLIVLMGKLKGTVAKINDSLDIVHDYLDEMKLPVRTIVNVSMSVEALRAASEQQIRKSMDTITASFNKIMEQLKTILSALGRKQDAGADAGEKQSDGEGQTIVIKPAAEQKKTENSVTE